MHRVLALLALAACASPPKASPQSSVAPPLGDLTVDTQSRDFGVVFAGGSVTLVASHATPGDRVRFGLGRALGAGPCPSSMAGHCLDLDAPTLLGSAVANAQGVATLERVLPSDLPATTVWIQAVADGTALEISPPVEVLVQPASWGGSLDCSHACSARPDDAGFCWFTNFQCMSSGTCVQECIADCQATQPSLDDTQQDALGRCAAADPQCFQDLDSCIDATARSGVWLKPRHQGETDADGDGRWSRGEVLIVDAALEALGIDFFDYPMLTLSADHPGVSLAHADATWYGIASGTALPWSFEATALSVPPGTDVTFTLEASSLGCIQGGWARCPLPNATTFTVQVW